MTPILKLKTACVAALMVFAVPITAAAETAGATATPVAVSSPVNTAIAVNNTPGTSIFDLAFSIKFTTAASVQPVNLALALSSCKSCQTVAIAIQVVIYTAGASVVAPVNAAVAVNYLCTLCDTLASAYQFVIGTAGPVRFTSKGRRAIRDIREELAALNDAGLTTAQIQARVAALMTRLANVLATQLVPVGKDNEGGYENQDSHAAESPSPMETPTASPTPTLTPAAAATNPQASAPPTVTPAPTQ